MATDGQNDLPNSNDTVVPDPKETTPEPEKIPPVVTSPVQADDNIKSALDELRSRVDELTESIAHVTGESDSKPTKRPWTHWGH
jgi:hypothetical protein